VASGITTRIWHRYIIDLVDPSTRTAAAKPDYWLGWGSATAALSIDDTDLSEHPEDRVVAVVTQADTNGAAQDGRHLRLKAEIEAAANRTVAEAGYYLTEDTSGQTNSTGDLFLRALFAAVPIETGDRIELDASNEQVDSGE
jgi:hypothetical protein